MNLRIYHNPRCSKSRESLRLLTEAGVEPDIVRYLETPPDAATIRRLARLVGVPVADLLRKGEDVVRNASDLPDLADDAGLAAWIADHPQALERPIVVAADGRRAVIGRPPVNVLDLVPE